MSVNSSDKKMNVTPSDKWNRRTAISVHEEFAFHQNVRSDINYDITGSV